MQSNDHETAEKSTHKKKFRAPKQENLKKGRLFIRNLPFKVTEEKLQKEFGKFGEVKEVKLLKKPDGKLIGCGFVQFEKYEDSVKAVKGWNGKPLMGRKIVVEFAVSKDRFLHQHPDKKKDTVETTKVADAKTDEKEEEDNDEIEDTEQAEVDSDGDAEESVNEAEEEDDSGLEDDDVEEDEVEKDQKVPEPPPKSKSREDDEELTIFIKNLSFDTTNDSLKEFFVQYGPIKYALVVRDRVSGHSKGTGFVKFLKKESVEKCLLQNGKVLLQNCLLEILPLLTKNRIEEMSKDKERKEPKDGRNLYLLREGMIHAGSSAAEGVSASDMAQRLRLEQVKSQMLKNLVRFLARDRLTIHNLPETMDSDKLKRLVTSRTKITPIECRVMRENKPSPGQPLGVSKGFAFMSFKTHEEALTVLRKINNNPTVFSPKKRPIVSFSIEDKNILKIKEKRAERSKMSNPTFHSKLEKLKLKRAQRRQNGEKGVKREIRAPTKNSKPNAQKEEETPAESYGGFEAKAGSIAKMRGNFKLKEQSRIHEKSMKERNKIVKREKMNQAINAEKEEKKLDKSSRKRKLHDEKKDNLSDMINKYKNMIGSNAKRAKTRGKWFNE